MISALAPAAGEHPLALDRSEAQKLRAGKVITTLQHSPPGVEVKAVMRRSPHEMLALLTNYEQMPQHIFGLERAEVLRRDGDTSTVRFTMKLPFPVGRVAWTNLIRTNSFGSSYALEWSLIDGDLAVNEGRIVMMPHCGDSDFTFADYTVRVQTRSVLPESAQRLATRWLLPKIVAKLRRVVEHR